MMMKMLAAGGIRLVTDGIRSPDDSNPEGYFELEAVKTLDKPDTRGDLRWLVERPRVCDQNSVAAAHLPSGLAQLSGHLHATPAAGGHRVAGRDARPRGGTDRTWRRTSRCDSSSRRISVRSAPPRAPRLLPDALHRLPQRHRRSRDDGRQRRQLHRTVAGCRRGDGSDGERAPLSSANVSASSREVAVLAYYTGLVDGAPRKNPGILQARL